MELDRRGRRSQNTTVEAAPTAAPITPTENLSQTLPSWINLSDAARQFLQEAGWAADESEYNQLLDDPAIEEALKNEMKCKGLL